MSATSQPSAIAPDSLFAERELTIEIRPRGHDWWSGTSAQLQAEGLIPEGFEWPKGRASRYWTAGQFEFFLCRVRPPGQKGRASSRLEADSWGCHRFLAGQERDGYAAARLYEVRVALAKELWSRTPEAKKQWLQFCAAGTDIGFQRFKALIPGLVRPKRGRRPT